MSQLGIQFNRLSTRFDRRALLWVFIAFLVACPRLFEIGLGLDPSLYASISRNFSRNWNWWHLSASENLFPNYFEHPFLHYWVQGIVFRIFGASDFTVRCVGLGFGLGTFYFIHRLGKELLNERYADIVCFLGLISIYFTGRFPSHYHEVPLTFFSLAALFFLVRSLKEKRLSLAVFSGLALGAAFLTKGLAALPLLATLGVYALWKQKLSLFRNAHIWVCFSVGFLVVAAFGILQSHYAPYSFLEEYLNLSLFRKVLRPGLRAFPHGYLWRIFETHPIHVLLAAGLFLKARRWNVNTEVLVFGTIASFFFILANSTQGYIHLHYFYSLYPMINFLSALFLYHWLQTREINWARIGLRLGLAYVIIWQLLPVHMRRTPHPDFYEIGARVEVIKSLGLTQVESLGISETDWIYREVSLWYWDIPTAIRKSVSELQGAVVVYPTDQSESWDESLANLNFEICLSGSKYRLMVKGADALRLCRSTSFPKRWLR